MCKEIKVRSIFVRGFFEDDEFEVSYYFTTSTPKVVTAYDNYLPQCVFLKSDYHMKENAVDKYDKGPIFLHNGYLGQCINCYVGKKMVLFDDIADKTYLRVIYDSPVTPLARILVSNPREFGTVILKIDLREQLNQRMLFTTGQLTGCYAGMLLKNDYLYIIHCGASNQPEGQQHKEEQYYGCILNALITLDQICDVKMVEYSQKEVFNSLFQYGYKGIFLVRDKDYHSGKLDALKYPDIGRLSVLVNREGVVSCMTERQNIEPSFKTFKQFRFCLDSD